MLGVKCNQYEQEKGFWITNRRWFNSVAGVAIIIRAALGETTRITASTLMNTGSNLSGTSALIVGGALVLRGLLVCYKA